MRSRDENMISQLQIYYKLSGGSAEISISNKSRDVELNWLREENIRYHCCNLDPLHGGIGKKISIANRSCEVELN